MTVPEVQTLPALTDWEEQELRDLQIFWGPEIVRLLYLRHLVESGRVSNVHDPEEQP